MKFAIFAIAASIPEHLSNQRTEISNFSYCWRNITIQQISLNHLFLFPPRSQQPKRNQNRCGSYVSAAVTVHGLFDAHL